jgi:Zn-dependent protease/predicted transcriptional regulator
LFGFEVNVDASWLLLAVLISWSLASGEFPSLTPGLTVATYWAMGIAATIGLFLSIVFHEMSHSLVARRYGLPIRGITLFIFGGVAEMTSEPSHPRDELLMAAAGPAASFVLAALFFASFALIGDAGGPPALAGVLWYLGFLNGVLAIFNLIPAFPLDGGRMLRAALWGWRGDYLWATRIAAGAGNIFGIILIVLGLFEIVQGDFVAGIWRFLIGMFLRGAATASSGEAMARSLLGGVPVARVMNSNPETVTPELSIDEFINNYVYRHHHRWFPVVRDGEVLGTVETRQTAAVERAQWPMLPIVRIMRPLSRDDTVAPEADAYAALEQMRRTGQTRLVAMQGGRLVGIVSSKDLLDVLSLDRELGRRKTA